MSPKCNTLQDFTILLPNYIIFLSVDCQFSLQPDNTNNKTCITSMPGMQECGVGIGGRQSPGFGPESESLIWRRLHSGSYLSHLDFV